MGFDLMVVTPAPKSSAILSLESFKQFGNVSKSTEMALFSTVPRIAIDLGVNTIFLGENTATQVGNNAVSGIDEFDANNLRNINTLSGEDEWIDEALDLVYKKNHYKYPTQIFFEKGVHIQ
jgi:hypothetical protein